MSSSKATHRRKPYDGRADFQKKLDKLKAERGHLDKLIAEMEGASKAESSVVTESAWTWYETPVSVVQSRDYKEKRDIALGSFYVTITMHGDVAEVLVRRRLGQTDGDDVLPISLGPVLTISEEDDDWTLRVYATRLPEPRDNGFALGAVLSTKQGPKIIPPRDFLEVDLALFKDEARIKRDRHFNGYIMGCDYNSQQYVYYPQDAFAMQCVMGREVISNAIKFLNDCLDQMDGHVERKLTNCLIALLERINKPVDVKFEESV